MTVVPERSLPDVSRLRLLREVSRHGSIAAAARFMGITSSAVSQQIGILERETGVPLLDRGHRGVALTGAGETLVEHAQAVLQLLEETRTAMDQLSNELAGRVRIGSITSAASSIVLPAAERLRRDSPNIQLAVTSLEPADSIDRVINGTLDLAVIDIYDHVPIPFPDYLQVEEILSEPLVLVTSPDFEAPPGLSLADLSSEPWVMPPSGAACGAAVRHACKAEGFEPTVHWETDDLLLLVESISQGQGIALLPRLAVAAEAAPVSIHVLSGAKLNRRVLTVCRSGSANRPIVRAVLDQLQHSAPAVTA